jgi:hypothetical protein
MANPTDDPEYRSKVKDASRQGRLSFRNRAEQLLRRDMKEEAIQTCKVQIGEFAECSKANGLMVVFRCRDHLKAMNDCMAVHNGEEAWQKYKEEHKKELEVRATGQKYV